MLEPALALILACGAVACGGADAPGTAAPARPNVLVFLVDAARADHFGAYGYARDTTPHADAFAATATRFTRAVSDGSFTFASVSALFTGLAPERTGLLSARRLGDDLSLLAEVAREAGYRTRGYSENPYVTPAFGFDRGFDDFQTTLDYAAWKQNTREFEHSDSRSGIDAMLDFMDAPSERPFLAYVHLLRPHNPYAPPADVAGRFGATDAERDGDTGFLLSLDKQKRLLHPKRMENIRALYDENLAAADAAFGRMLDGMRERGLLDETVVVLLSDHGEGFREHGRLLHGSAPFEEMIRIPLVVRVPGVAAGVVEHPVQLSDVGALLSQVVGGARPARDLASLGDPGGETVSWSMRHERRACLRAGSRKLFVETEGLEPTGYYDLEADPGEHSPLPLDDEGRRMLASLQQRIRSGAAAAAASPVQPIDPALREQIRALGYVEE